MAAAVADYMPEAGSADQKLEKSDGLTLRLTRTPDILAELGARRGDTARPVLIGFAAQTGDPIEAARRKLASKRVDLVVANDVSAPGSGFDVDTNEVALVSEAGVTRLPLQTKTAVAAAILDRAEALLAHPAPTLSR
jgi:phosphopantothenoylcysteine decarboxylase/phosphopantothenate--cysteine ligase